MTITTRPVRPLGILEKYQVSKQITKAYGNITMTARLEHPHINGLSDYLSHLKGPLTTLIQNNPHLSVVVRDITNNDVHFEQLSHINLESIVQVVSDPVDLEELIRQQTSQEFDLDGSLPLWRILISPETTTRSTFVLTSHHVIMDGMSLTIFWKQFLQALNGPRTDPATLVTVKANTVAPPYELSGAPQLSILTDVLPLVVKTITSKFLPSQWFKPASHWKGDHPAIEGEGHDTLLRTIAIEPSVWQAWMDAAETSVHAILYAVLLKSWARVFPGETTEVSTPINCRGLCKPAVPGDQMGNYVSAYTDIWKAQELDDVWEVARRYGEALREGKAGSAKFTLFLKFLPDFPASYCDYWYDKRKESDFGRSGGLELSDMGRLSLERGGWAVEEVFFCQSAQIFTGVFHMNSVTFERGLYCTLSWQKGAVDEEKMDRLKDTFISILKTDMPLSK